MQCDLLESWFISVAPTDLFFFPASNTSLISCFDFTTNIDKSLTYTPVSGFSFKSNLFLGFLLNKSLISSFYISNILDLIKNSLSGKPSIYKNMLRNDRGIIPSKTALGSPSIVKVLPVPVCPYANIVPFYPSIDDWTIGYAVFSNIYSCVLFQS